LVSLESDGADKAQINSIEHRGNASPVLPFIQNLISPVKDKRDFYSIPNSGKSIKVNQARSDIQINDVIIDQNTPNNINEE
jgi:hypothetical protein